MTTEPAAPARSRRALLTAAAAAGAATVVAAVARPLPAAADNGESLLLGTVNSATDPTVFNGGDASPALHVNSGGGNAIEGKSTGSFGVGVHGTAEGGGNGVEGHAVGEGVGVVGFSDSGPAGTGVTGFAADGMGGYFYTTSPLIGIGLMVTGKVRLDQAAGVKSISKGRSSVVVTPGCRLSSSSAVTATLMSSAGGVITVHRVAINARKLSFTIYLTGTATRAAKIAWHVFN